MSQIESVVNNKENCGVETCQLAQEEIAKVQKRNRTYYNRRSRERRLNIGDSVLLLLPTENYKLTLAWRGPYEVVEKLGEVDYKIRVTTDKIKTYHINMLKKYHQRKEQRIENDGEKRAELVLSTRGGAHRKERSVIRNDDDVGGRARVTRDEERVRRAG